MVSGPMSGGSMAAADSTSYSLTAKKTMSTGPTVVGSSVVATMAERQSGPIGDDAARWEAVVARDRRADGHFVYAVRSTGVYCRPSCASRRPRRAVVTFYDDPALAERAGFRACRRCKPRE